MCLPFKSCKDCFSSNISKIDWLFEYLLKSGKASNEILGYISGGGLISLDPYLEWPCRRRERVRRWWRWWTSASAPRGRWWRRPGRAWWRRCRGWGCWRPRWRGSCCCRSTGWARRSPGTRRTILASYWISRLTHLNQKIENYVVWK